MTEPARGRPGPLANRAAARSRMAISAAVPLTTRRHVDLVRVAAQRCPR